ncbi:Hypothetical predicted protein [Marmota monax]|uniref:Uncharacterized protein n=1 Tax=Marmota monax TaxID=9995 RepID=A0A5E4ANH4_MARMO|nr:Hypothetical predicted protein [Marmota monax]
MERQPRGSDGLAGGLFRKGAVLRRNGAPQFPGDQDVQLKPAAELSSGSALLRSILQILRLVEIFSAAPIGPHWGVLSKCLAYGKAASDPFVYCLLRHQYRRSCREILNRVLHRRSIRSSGLTGDSHSQNILPVSE